MHESDERTGRRIAGLVLAAGMSSRMQGAFKPLMPLGCRPIVAWVVQSIESVGQIDPVIVVTGHQSDRVAEALSDLAVTFVLNPNFERGEMLSSIQSGLRRLPLGIDGFLLALGDQPGISPHTIRLLIEGWAHSPSAIVLPAYQGRRGHPILFPARCVSEILALAPDQTLKSVTHRPGQQVVQISVEDPEVCMDIDTPRDYQDLLSRWAKRPAGQTATEARHGPSLGSGQIGR